MNTFIKKITSAVAAASIMASSIAGLYVNAYAADTYTVTFDYGDGRSEQVIVDAGAVVQELPEPPSKKIIEIDDSAAHDGTAMLIRAEYAEEGELNAISMSEMTLSDGQTELELPSDGGTYMLWDSLEGMTPLGTEDEKSSVWVYDGTLFTKDTPVWNDITVTAVYGYEPSVPTETPGTTAQPTARPDYAETRSFVFGADGEGTLTVLADTAYGEQANGMTYGLIDIDENSAMNDFRFDGFTDDVLTYVVNGETGGAGYVTADYSQYDEETLAAFGDGVVPVRFAAEAETGAYYTVSATIVNTSGTESTEASLFGENRYAVLYNHKLAPGESVTRTWNVNLVGQYYNATGAYIDTAVNVAAAGKNVGLARVEIHKHKEPGKTIWLMTDSTGDNSSAELPYFGLRGKCGVGQMLAKYLPPDIAVNNQGEGGLNSSDTAHFNNALQYMKEGDYLYIQYGFNGETTESLLKNLPRYYSAANERGVKMIVASTTERQSSSFWDSETGKWNASNAAIAAAGKQYVEGLVADGAKDIAFIDLNTAMNEWMNKTTADIYEQRVRLGFEDSAPSRLAMNYYYGFDRDSGVDSIHINDAGADNAAYLVMSEIRKTVDAGGAQADVLRELTLNAPDSKPYTIPDELASKGWVPNESYPYPLPSDVTYEYPTIVKDIDIENGQLVSIEVMVQGDMQYYALGAADILDADGNVINTVYSVSTDVNPLIGHIDNTACSYGQIYKMYFENVAVGEGQTVRAYTAALQSGETELTGERYSSYYIEEPVEKVLLDETFINGAEGWLEGGSSAVKETVNVTKDGKNALKLYQNGSGTYNVYKRFDDNAEVSNGIIRLRFMLCHEYGSYTLKLTPRTSSGSYIEGLKLIDVKDGTLLLQNGTEIGRIKTGKWTDVECRVDLLNGTVTASVAGGTPVTEENDLLRSESTEELTDMLPFKGMAVAYMSTGSTIPSYSFETYIAELTAELLQCELPSFTVTAGVEESCAAFGTVEGGGEYAINETVTLKARAEDGYEFVGWYDGNGNEVSARSEYSFRVRGDKALYARFEEEVYDPNVTKWSFSQFKDGEEIIADDENQVEYNGMIIHINSGDSITEDGLYWNAPGGTKSDSTTTVTNNRYIEFVPERPGTISITFKGSKESDRNYPRLYISCGESLDCTTKDASAAQLEGNRQFDNKEGDGQYATMTAELTAGMRYYIWAYYYSRPAANFTISEIVYTAEPGTTVEPTQTPGGEDTGEPVWDFSKYAGDASVTTDGELSLDYIEGGQTLEVHLNSGDSMTENGLVWTAPGSTTSDGKTVTNNRYIMYTPSADGTLRLTFSGDKRNSSSKAPRIYVVPGEDESCMSKTNSDANGVQQTASAANTDTELTAQLSAGKTYYIWPYYYNDSSVSFTVSNIVFEKAEAAVSTRNIYGSNMLLQRGEPVVIDGKADAADAVTVTLTNETTGEDVQTVTGAAVAEDGAWNGKDWSVTLDAVSDYESSYKLTISAEGAETVEYTNILFGDLYLFTGQSNMWKQVSYYKNIDSEAYGTAAVAANATDKIRVMHTAGSGDYGTAVLQYDALNAQPWRDFSTYENVSDISAPAYTAAVTMYKETGVPIGIITNAYPGSYISSWFDSALAIDACNLGKNGSANERNWYCGRIYPLRNLRLSGIFWYQGEADAAKTYHDDPYSYYSQMLPKLIDSWRELFADDTLPFYYVQLSRIGTTIVDENNPDTGAAGKMPIKLAQTDVYLAMEDKTNVGIISTLDLYGNHDAEGTANCRTDIHLGQKDVIGKRMAAYALQDIYGKDTYADGSAVYEHGPIYKSSAVKDGKIEITFECSGQLRIMPSEQYTDTEGERLISEGAFDPAKLNEFEIAGEDGVWHEAEAEMTGTDTVTVSSQEVPAPVKVRYCGRDYPESPNLTDDSGLPSYVFEKTAAAEEPSPTATAEPSETPGAEIAATYKFDFGSGAAAEGWTAVTPDMVYDMSVSEDAAEGTLYGFLGTTETSYDDDVLPYDCDSRAIDGFSLVKGQQIVLTAGGDDSKNDAASDYIAVPEKSSYLPSNASEYEGRFPIRFSMKAENGSYYTVTATIANASDTEKAYVSLFSEKRQMRS